MKINSKGFLLAETIVTVCVIAALATSMYLYISNTTSRFEERDNYENVVDIYKVNTLKEYLLNYCEVNNTDINNYVSANDLSNLEIYSSDLFSKLNISLSFLIENSVSGKEMIYNTTGSQALDDYLDWIEFPTTTDGSLRLIVWFNSDDNDGTFANLVIK